MVLCCGMLVLAIDTMRCGLAAGAGRAGACGEGGEGWRAGRVTCSDGDDCSDDECGARHCEKHERISRGCGKNAYMNNLGIHDNEVGHDDDYCLVCDPGHVTWPHILRHRSEEQSAKKEEMVQQRGFGRNCKAKNDRGRFGKTTDSTQ